MSNTIITNYSDISGRTTKPENQLVVFANKDGTYSVEKAVLDSLLEEKSYENTSISVVHINEDGKPEDASDHSSDDESIPHINLTVNSFYSTDGLEPLLDENESEYDRISKEFFMLSFQNDHCYTPYTSENHSESESLYPDNERVSAGMHKSTIPSSKKITILENKIITKGKNPSALHAVDSRNILKGIDILKKSTLSPSITPIVNINRNINLENRALLLKKNQTKASGHEKDRSSSESVHDEDRDSDSDYHNLSKNKQFGKSFKPKPSINKNVKKLLNKKLESKRALKNVSEADLDKIGKPVKIKTFSRLNTSRRNPKKVIGTQEPLKCSERIMAPIATDDADSFAKSVKDKLKVDSKPDISKAPKSVLKKDKKPPAHITVLLNDMTSLFSTPDVLRKNSTETKISSKIPEKTPAGLSKRITEFVVQADTTLPDRVDSDSLKISKTKHETKTYSNSSKSHSKNFNRQRDVKPLGKSLDLISPLDDETLTRLLQETDPEILAASPNPQIDFETSLMPNIIKKHTPPDGPCLSASASASRVANAPLSPGLDILAGLQPEEEGLTEDLLMHVAQLVQSSENLQEVIDKQVLGKVSDVGASKEILPPNHAVKMELLNNQFDRTEAAASPTPALRKEPIQIMRSNGRIITLPPIEAPATRSSKRKSLLNTSVSEPISPATDPALNKMTTPATQAVMIKRATQQPPTKKVLKLVTPPLQPSVPAQLAPTLTQKDDDDAIESDESWNSEDDPDRLWCICKQPHNNRFMICCDLCEDWFHGKCVNITKTMGQEMEEKGVEWRCPNCLKKKPMAKNVLKMSTSRKSTESKSEEETMGAFSHLPADPVSGSPPGGTFCIVCKKAARASSIYCSDACILRHAHESLGTAPSPNANLKNNAAKEDISDKQKPVIVFERNTGRCLAGPSAPTEANLKVWLQQNPTFEVIHPGKNNLNKTKPKVQSVLKISNDKHIIIMQPPNKNPAVANKTPLKIVKSPTVSPKTPAVRPAPLKQNVKSPATPKTPQLKQPSIKSPTSTTPTQKKDEFKFKSSSSEPIRENVKKILQEQLSLRMSESSDVKFTREEIVKFAVDTEIELHNLFKDVGAKYKAKYRSLMFNLKDRKNLSLWQKICDRSLTPKQLVRLSPEELASQELAQWRDKEAKHQLELIKKSELDLLSCSKTYVLKTHKGEEVMESRTTDTTELDPNVAVEDLVSALNNTSAAPDEPKDGTGRSVSPSSPHKRKHDQKHSSHHKHSKHKTKQHYKSSKSSHRRDRSSSRSRKTSAKHSSSSSKEGRGHGDSHRRKSSRDDHYKEDKSEAEKSRRTSSHSHSRSSTGRSKSKSRRKESPDRKGHKRSRSRETSKTRSLSKEFEKHNSSSKEESKHRSLSKESDQKSKSTKEHRESKESVTKETHDPQPATAITDKAKSGDDTLAANRIPPLPEIKEADVTLFSDVKSPPTPGTPEISSEHRLPAGTESDQEPTSTNESMLSVVWEGSVNMIDVAKFNATAYEVSGHCEDLTTELGSDLDVVGRISPEIVWDYINKMKKQGNKDIVVIKLAAANKEETSEYNELFKYFNVRNRLGVVKVSGTDVKDFYILPLSSHSPLPSVLLPLHGPGFQESRPHLLIGLIIRQRKKRGSQGTPYVPVPAKMAKILEETDRSYTPPPDDSYTPPTTPKRLPLPGSTPAFLPALSSTVKDKIAASLACAEDDEPYSPGGSDSNSVDSLPPPPLPSLPLPPLPPAPRHSTDLQKKMEELNRKIEEKKKQIQYMAVNISSKESLDEPYSPSGSPSAAEAPLASLSSISLPSNLQEILASIKSQARPVDEGYVPTAVSLNPDNSAFYRDGGSADVDMRVPPQPFLPLPSVDTSSKLSKLSEAELLSMVPDEELLSPVYPPLPSLPPPPLLLNSPLSVDVNPPPPPSKRKKLDPSQPPPPGMEDED